ncbi:MAG: 5-methylthioadenosine/S-adenosylhomocysteine nucleosidase [Thermoleophilia bacterium]|nr:5-methylthioadenosine/S-adenosylhomocysteine nucleosidase [Thermoleophilia bacterium]
MLLVIAATDGELRGVTGLPGVERLTCGIGPVDAAIAVSRRLARGSRPRAILHVGIAGARSTADIPIGTVVVGAASTYADTQSHLVTRELPGDAELVAKVRAAFPDAVATVIGTAADVGGTTDTEVEAMEGFAVLRAADVAGVPAVEVRVISNEVGEPDRARWDFELALDTLAAALPKLVLALQ